MCPDMCVRAASEAWVNAGKGKQTTIVDVAREARVSVATAARALGAYGYVRPETREAILATAQAMNYNKNSAAQSLSSGRARTIGIIVSDITSEFYSAIVRSAVDYARQQGYCVLIYDTHESLEIEKEAVTVFRNHRVDGIIISPADPNQIDHLREFLAGGGQMVQIDRRIASLASDSVTLDNRGTANECTKKLLEAGHRRIAYVGELEELAGDGMAAFVDSHAQKRKLRRGFAPSVQRLLGFLDAHREMQVPACPELIGRAGYYAAEAAEVASERVFSHAPTALLTSDGLMTVGAFRAIRAHGKRIPQDLSFISFDDLEWMQFVNPSMSAIAQPCTAIGATAARLVITRAKERGNGKPSRPKHIRFAGSIIDRHSVSHCVGNSQSE